jgi:hypothetical protein
MHTHAHIIRQLYRDCLRLIRHVAPGRTSPKSAALRLNVRSQFDKYKDTKGDDVLIHAAKANAVRALSNYMLQQAAPKDPKVKAAMKDFHGRAVKDAKDYQKNIKSNSNSNSNSISESKGKDKETTSY